jgi:hypothetical protein
MNCRICSVENIDFFSRAIILGKHDVRYFRCINCGFIFTEDPSWLEEAYSEAITGSDVGLVTRNIQLAQIARLVISCFFGKKGRFLDYAGGSGLLVRLMRDSGLDFYWHDKYCRNIFARQFEGLVDGKGTFELLTAFEVFEHLVDPLTELKKMLSLSRNVLFTTQLIPAVCPKPGEWWYYGPEHGQHISFYSMKSLKIAAMRLGVNFYSNGSSMHLFTDRKLPKQLFYIIARSKTAMLLSPFLRKRSLLADDFSSTSGSKLT